MFRDRLYPDMVNMHVCKVSANQ